MGEERQGRPPVRAQGAAVRRGSGRSSRARARVQGRDPRRPPGARRRQPGNRRRSRPSTSTAHSTICVAARTSSRRARSARSSSSPSRAPTGAATRSARRCSASTARSGRRRRSSTNTCGAARRPRSATTAASACSSTCSASTTSRPGRAFWHPKGWTLYQHAARRDARAPGAPRLRGDLHAAARPPEAVGAVRPLGRCTATTCSSSRPRGRSFSLKPMNCPESTFIYRSRRPLVPRAAVAPVRVRRAAPQRAVGRRSRGSRASATSSRTMPTSTSGRTRSRPRSRR